MLISVGYSDVLHHQTFQWLIFSLDSRFIVSKLPDKGQKLIEKNNAIQNELETRQKATDDIISSIREMKIDCTASNEKKTKHSNQLNSEKKQPSLSSSCSSLSQEG